MTADPKHCRSRDRRASSDRRPGPHQRADRLRRRRRPDPAALAADVAAGLGPRAHRQPGGALAAARRRRARAHAPGDRPLYDAFEHPRAERPTLPLLPPAEARRYVARGARPGAGPARARRRFDGAEPLVDSGFAFGMIAQHEQQHDETMLITHQLGAGPRCCPRRPAARRPPTRAPAGRGARARRAVHHGHLDRAVGAGQRTAGAPGGRWPPSSSTPSRSPTPRTPRSSRTAATTTPRWWTPAGWEHRQRGRTDRAAVLAPGRRSVAATPVRRDRTGAAGRAGTPRLLVRGRRLRPVGRTPAAHRGRVGEGRAARPGDRRSAALSVGRRRPDAEPPTWASGTCSRRRPARTPRAPRRTASGS